MRRINPGGTPASAPFWLPILFLVVVVGSSTTVESFSFLPAQNGRTQKQSTTTRGGFFRWTEGENNDATSVYPDDGNSNQQLQGMVTSRREALMKTIIAATVAMTTATTASSKPAFAAAEDDDEYVQRGNGFAFKFIPPPEMEPGSKPVKTHLFEINWKSQTTSRYTFGVTVDPVRIQSLKEFGTPEEVAAKVVTAEVNRDGIFEVKLVKDPVVVVDENTGVISYVLNYLSQGKRGDKRFVAKFCIENQRLYALTAQVLESDYNEKEKELMKAIDSFRVLSST